MATATAFSSPPPGRRADEGETIAQLQAHFRVELHALQDRVLELDTENTILRTRIAEYEARELQRVAMGDIKTHRCDSGSELDQVTPTLRGEAECVLLLEKITQLVCQVRSSQAAFYSQLQSTAGDCQPAATAQADALPFVPSSVPSHLASAMNALEQSSLLGSLHAALAEGRAAAQAAQATYPMLPAPLATPSSYAFHAAAAAATESASSAATLKALNTISSFIPAPTRAATSVTSIFLSPGQPAAGSSFSLVSLRAPAVQPPTLPTVSEAPTELLSLQSIPFVQSRSTTPVGEQNDDQAHEFIDTLPSDAEFDDGSEFDDDMHDIDPDDEYTSALSSPQSVATEAVPALTLQSPAHIASSFREKLATLTSPTVKADELDHSMDDMAAAAVSAMRHENQLLYQNDMAAAANALDRAQAEIAHLKRELQMDSESAERQRVIWQQRYTRLMDHTARVEATLARRQATAQQNAADLVTLRDEVTELNTRLQLTESALDNARDECDELGAQLQHSQSEAEALANTLQQAVHDAEEHSAALFEELERVRAEFQVPQDETDLVAHLSAKWQDLQKSIESARSTSDAVRQELESCQTALVAEQTARSRSDAQAAKLFVQLTDQTQQMSVLAEKSVALEQRAVNAELARDYAVERIEKLEHQLSDAEECLEAERKTVDSLNADNEASTAEIERLNSSIADLEASLDRTEQTLQVRTAECNAQSLECDVLATNLERATTDLASVRAELTSCRDSLADVQTKLQVALEEGEAASNRAQQQEQRANETQSMFDACVKRAAAAEDRAARAEQQCIDLQQEMDQLRESAAQRETELIAASEALNQRWTNREQELLQSAAARESELIGQAAQREAELAAAAEQRELQLKDAAVALDQRWRSREQELIQSASDREAELITSAQQREEQLQAAAAAQQQSLMDASAALDLRWRGRERDLLDSAAARESELLADVQRQTDALELTVQQHQQQLESIDAEWKQVTASREAELKQAAEQRELELINAAQAQEQNLKSAAEALNQRWMTREQELLQSAAARETELIDQAAQREADLTESAAQREQQLRDAAAALDQRWRNREQELIQSASDREAELISSAHQRENELKLAASSREQELQLSAAQMEADLRAASAVSEQRWRDREADWIANSTRREQELNESSARRESELKAAASDRERELIAAADALDQRWRTRESELQQSAAQNEAELRRNAEALDQRWRSREQELLQAAERREQEHSQATAELTTKWQSIVEKKQSEWQALEASIRAEAQQRESDLQDAASSRQNELIAAAEALNKQWTDRESELLQTINERDAQIDRSNAECQMLRSRGDELARTLLSTVDALESEKGAHSELSAQHAATLTKLNSLECQLGDSISVNHELTARLQSAGQVEISLRNDLDAARGDAFSARADATALQGRVSDLETEVQKTSNAVVAALSARSLAEENAARDAAAARQAEDELSSTRTELQQCSSELKQATQQVADLQTSEQSLQSKLENVTAEFEQTSAALSSTTAERVSLTEALRASQEQSAALNQAFSSLRVNADQLSARVADLEAKNTAAAAEARQRVAEIQLLRTAAAAREEALSQATQRCARAVSTADERERDCQRWRDKVQRLTALLQHTEESLIIEQHKVDDLHSRLDQRPSELSPTAAQLQNLRGVPPAALASAIEAAHDEAANEPLRLSSSRTTLPMTPISNVGAYATRPGSARQSEALRLSLGGPNGDPFSPLAAYASSLTTLSPAALSSALNSPASNSTSPLAAAGTGMNSTASSVAATPRLGNIDSRWQAQQQRAWHDRLDAQRAHVASLRRLLESSAAANGQTMSHQLLEQALQEETRTLDAVRARLTHVDSSAGAPSTQQWGTEYAQTESEISEAQRRIDALAWRLVHECDVLIDPATAATVQEPSELQKSESAAKLATPSRIPVPRSPHLKASASSPAIVSKTPSRSSRPSVIPTPPIVKNSARRSGNTISASVSDASSIPPSPQMSARSKEPLNSARRK